MWVPSRDSVGDLAGAVDGAVVDDDHLEARDQSGQNVEAAVDDDADDRLFVVRR
jgi:hypothetical protein